MSISFQGFVGKIRAAAAPAYGVIKGLEAYLVHPAGISALLVGIGVTGLSGGSFGVLVGVGVASHAIGNIIAQVAFSAINRQKQKDIKRFHVKNRTENAYIDSHEIHLGVSTALTMTPLAFAWINGCAAANKVAGKEVYGGNIDRKMELLNGLDMSKRPKY